MGSHHGPAGEKRARTRWGLLWTEVSRHGGLPRGGLGPLSPSLVAGGRRKSKLCHHPPTANQASSQMGKPSLLTDQAIAIFPSTIPRPAGNIATHLRPVTENAVPAPPAPTPLIGTPAKTSWGGGENPGFRSTGLRPLQTPQAKRPDATTPRRQSGSGSAVLKTNVPSCVASSRLWMGWVVPCYPDARVQLLFPPFSPFFSMGWRYFESKYRRRRETRMEMNPGRELGRKAAAAGRPSRLAPGRNGPWRTFGCG